MEYEDKFTIVIHDGKFHADEILCLGLFGAFVANSGIEVIRIPHQIEDEQVRIMSEADYVFDVGGMYDSSKYFDHHQMPKENDKAACKLFWDHLVKKYNLDLKYYKKIDELITEVSLDDTGKVVANSKTLSGIIDIYNQEGIYGEQQEKAFKTVSSFVCGLIMNMKEEADAILETVEFVKNTPVGKYGEMIFPKKMRGMSTVVNGVNTPHIKRMLWLNDDRGVYYIKIPNTKEGSYDLVTKQFEQDPEMVFVHSNGFLATAKSIDTVYKFLEKNKE